MREPTMMAESVREDPRFVIWSWEHAAWWRPFEVGYTANLGQAGRYDYDRAADIVDHADGNEMAIDESLVTPTMRRVIDNVQELLSPGDRLPPFIIERAPWRRRRAEAKPE